MEVFKVKKYITLNRGIASELLLIEKPRDFRRCWQTASDCRCNNAAEIYGALTFIIPSGHVLVSRKYCQMV
jgi:hypothetical protein